MTAKLDIYRKFTNALAIAVIVSVGWICYEVMLVSYFNNSNPIMLSPTATPKVEHREID